MQEFIRGWCAFWGNVGWHLGQAWDAIGGLTGLFYGLIVGGCLLGLVWTLRAYWPKATALIAGDEEQRRIDEIVEPITEPMPVVSVPQDTEDWQGALTKLAEWNKEVHEARIGVFPLDWTMESANSAMRRFSMKKHMRGEI